MNVFFAHWSVRVGLGGCSLSAINLDGIVLLINISIDHTRMNHLILTMVMIGTFVHVEAL